MRKGLYHDLLTPDALTCTLSDRRIKQILSDCFIIQHSLKNDPNKAELASSLLFQLIMEVVIDQNDILEKQRPAWLVDLLKAVQAPENQSWRVTDVVHHCNYSHSQISRAFRTYLKCSISEYLNEVKTQSAHDYLIYSDQTIYGIAFTLGYKSATNFSAVFKKKYGACPARYRKKWQRQRTNNQ